MPFNLLQFIIHPIEDDLILDNDSDGPKGNQPPDVETLGWASQSLSALQEQIKDQILAQWLHFCLSSVLSSMALWPLGGIKFQTNKDQDSSGISNENLSVCLWTWKRRGGNLKMIGQSPPKASAEPYILDPDDAALLLAPLPFIWKYHHVPIPSIVTSLLPFQSSRPNFYAFSYFSSSTCYWLTAGAASCCQSRFRRRGLQKVNPESDQKIFWMKLAMMEWRSI